MKDEGKIVSDRLDSETYHFIFKTAIEIFEEISSASKRFPKEKFYLTDQVIRHSRLVCTNLAEAWQMKDDRSIFLASYRMRRKPPQKHKIAWSLLQNIIILTA